MTSLLFAFYLVSPSRFNYAKFHSLNHLVGLVERFGPPMQYNMQPFEGMHRPLIKVGVRMTNFRGHIALAVMKRVSSGRRSGRWRLVVGQVAACQLRVVARHRCCVYLSRLRRCLAAAHPSGTPAAAPAPSPPPT
jgi:hypothetical protein